ncbi:MAG: S41 family peptidase [Crocinitomicaceae bacterium]
MKYFQLRFLSVPFLFISLFGFGQNLSKTQLLIDLRYMDSAFRVGHPSNLAFDQKLDFRLKIKEVTAKLPETLSAVDYENAVREVLMEVKCLHTSYSAWSGKITTSTKKDSVFPYFIFTNGEKIWVNQKVQDSLPSSLEIGDEIISINGHRADSVLAILMNCHPDDGTGRQISKYIVNNLFPEFLTKYIPVDSVYTVVAKNELGTVHTSVVQACAYRQKVEVDKKVLVQGNQAYYSVLHDSLGYLRIKSIQGKENSFYEKVFRMIADSNVKTLILDLRNNPGGNLFTCMDFLSYLLPDTSYFTFTYPTQNLRPYFSWKDRQKLTIGNAMLRLLKSDSFEKTDEGKVNTFFIYPNPTLGFNGKLFVLTNELTASGASLISSFARHRRESTLIGQTTGGGEYWLNASVGKYPLLELPQSGILIQTSTHIIRYDTPALHFNGITPDILLEYDATTFGKRDLELEKIYELIGQ